MHVESKYADTESTDNDEENRTPVLTNFFALGCGNSLLRIGWGYYPAPKIMSAREVCKDMVGERYFEAPGNVCAVPRDIWESMDAVKKDCKDDFDEGWSDDNTGGN